MEAPKRGLDLAGLKWARLLSDPCGAEMVSPCYVGSGTGQFMRVRNNISPITANTNTSFQFTYVPGKNLFFYGETVGNSGGVIGAYTSVGNSLSLISDSYRCVAACLRVIYTGTESNRQGLIGLASLPNPLWGPGDLISSPSSLPSCVKVSRTGEVVHEVKWVPQLEDQDFTNASATYESGRSGALMAIGLNANPTGTYSITMELTAVYEYFPKYNGGIVTGIVPPKSSSTFNDVMRAMGDTAKWVYSNVAVPVVKATAGLAVETVTSAPQLAGASASALRMLTL